MDQIDQDTLAEDCRRLAGERYGQPPSPYISARLKANYHPPEDHYEALMERLVDDRRSWLDVGCGRAPFPNNLKLSARLSARCPCFVGVDPDASVCDNRFVHEWRQATLEEFHPADRFDLISARMVIEHVSRPQEFAESLARIARPGALVVLFTVHWWSASAVAAHLSPMAVHHWVKRRLWGTNEADTFPTAYKLNRRPTLRRVMQSVGFDECHFKILPDASLMWRIPGLRRLELALFCTLRACCVPYPESDLLAVYRRID